MNRIDANPGNYGVDTSALGSENKRSGGGWGYQLFTAVSFMMKTVWSLFRNIDNNAYLMVDGRTLLDDTGWNHQHFKTDLGRGGWFDFELRMGNV